MIDNRKKLLNDKTTMSKQALIIIALLVAIATGLLLVAILVPYSSLVSSPQTTISIKPPIGQTDLIFGELSLAVSNEDNSTPSATSNVARATTPTYSLPLLINTRRNAVTAVQVELSFDPELLANISIRSGSFFDNPITLLDDIDQTTGRISYALGVGPKDNATRGEGVLLYINFKTKATTPQTTSISFLPKTLVTAEGVPQSVLRSTAPAKFTVPLPY